MRSKTVLLLILGFIWAGILGFIYLDSSQDNLTKAQKIINKFMIARLQSNQPEAENFLSDRARFQYGQPGLTLIGGSNPHFTNYRIVETVTEGDEDTFSATFVVRIYEEYTGIDEANAYFDETLTVRMLGDNSLQIDSVTRGEYVFL